ncbi:MAG: LysM peptidoglycan-binding domain-containing protein [Stenotrophobium sp.]
MHRIARILLLTFPALLSGCATPVWIPVPAPRAQVKSQAVPSLPGRVSAAKASEEHDLLLARNALPRLYTYTGLSDAQLQQVHEVELAIAQRQGHRAWQLASELEQQLKNRITHHRVARGESLWTISGREDIYDNPWLWPLIWDANRDTVRDPSRLRAGQTLKIRPNPTIKEVVRAVNYAHEHAGSHIHIGEVREVSQ